MANVLTIIVFGILYYYSKKVESCRKQDMYNHLNQQSRDEMEKWRK